MALPAYLTLTACTQGRIEGSVTQKGREGDILVVGAFHRIIAPRDPASGAPTGKRAHKPFVVVHGVDAATPKIYQALATNERFPSWRLRFYRPSPDGSERHYYTVTLADATISAVRFHLPNTRDARLGWLAVLLEVHFTYRRIEWANHDANVFATDDWEAPKTS